MIESKYLFLLTTPSNIKRAEIMKESFSKEIEIYCDFRDGNKQKPILYDTIYKEIKRQNPIVNNIIGTLKEQTIIIKKNEGLQEYFDVLDVEKAMVRSRNHITHKMKTYEWMTLGNARSDFRDLMKNLIEAEVPFLLEYVYFNHYLEEIYIQMANENKLKNDDVELLLRNDKFEIQNFIKTCREDYEKIGKENKFLKDYKLKEWGSPVISTRNENLYSIRTMVLRDRFSIIKNDKKNNIRFRFSTKLNIFDMEADIFEYLDNI